MSRSPSSLEPAPKRVNANTPAASTARARVSEAIADLAFRTPEFDSSFLDLQIEYMKSLKVLRRVTSDREDVKNLLFKGVIDSSVLDELKTKVDAELMKIAEEVRNHQDMLIKEMFEFTKEAAMLLNVMPFPSECEDSAALLKLAKSAQSISKADLQTYAGHLQPVEQATQRQYLFVLETTVTTNSSADALQQYVDSGKIIRADEAASKFIDALWSGFQSGSGMGAFNALCVPSGTGKTQLAFSMPENCAVIYMNMSEEDSISCTSESKCQDVYRNFVHYMTQVIQGLNKDVETKTRYEYSLWTYGVVAALMNLLQKYPELKLPSDLSKIRVTLSPSENGGRTFEIAPVSAGTAEAAVKAFEQLTQKQVLFFVDEFTANPRIHHKTLAFFRRRLMNLGACVVVASTDSAALNVMSAGAANEPSWCTQEPSVHLCTQLPQYVPHGQLIKAVNSIQGNDGVKRLLQLCLKSRPRFALAVDQELKKFLANTQLWTQEGVHEFAETLRTTVVKVMRAKQESLTREGCFGYIAGMLTAGYCLEDEYEYARKLLGNLSTKNWAYLVNEQALAQADALSKIPKTERPARAAPAVGLDNLFISLFRRSKDEMSPSCLFYKIGPYDTDGPDFCCSTYFPKPEDDFLLFLGLAGSLASPGLRIKEGREFRVSAAKLSKVYLSEPGKVRKPLKNSKAFMPKAAEFEMNVCAAFITACNSGPIRGSPLHEFLTRFTAELLDSPEANYAELITADEINWNGTYEAQFMWPYNAGAPVGLGDTLNIIESTRPANNEMFDAGTFVRTLDNRILYTSIAEAKSAVRPGTSRDKIVSALKRQDINARVSFMVLERTIENLRRFDLSEFDVQDRGQGMQAQNLANACLFKVKIDKTRKVVLVPLNKGRIPNQPDRLIFVFSTDDLKTQFKAADKTQNTKE